MNCDLQKHAVEFRGYLNRHQYEVTDEGILFPKAGALASGEYFFDTDGGRSCVSPNLIPTAALEYILNAALGGTAQLPNWYLAIFSGAYTPTPDVTAATFAAAATEITSASEGYSAATRPAWIPSAAVGGEKGNLASRAAFSLKTTASVTIRGAALLSSPIKGGGAGVLASISRFANDRIEYDGNVFNLGYRARLRSE